MALKKQTILALITALTTPLACASYGQFKIDLPVWLILLAIGLAILLLTPVWWSLWLTGKRISGSRLSAREGKLLRLWSGVNFFYAAAYLLGAIRVINIPMSRLLGDADFFWWVILPVLLLTVLAIAGIRLGLNVEDRHTAASRAQAGEDLSD